MNELLKEMYDGETVEYKTWNITKVPGGWIFEHKITQKMVFVPIPGI